MLTPSEAMPVDTRVTSTSPTRRRPEPEAPGTAPASPRTRAEAALSPRAAQGHTSSLPPRTAAPSTASVPHTRHDLSPERPRPSDQRCHELPREAGPLMHTSSTERIDFGTFLAGKRHPTTIQGVRLSGDSISLKELRLCNLHFDDCKFEWSHFSGAHLVNCRFVNCDFENSAFMNSILHGSAFQKCNMQEGSPAASWTTCLRATTLSGRSWPMQQRSTAARPASDLMCWPAARQASSRWKEWVADRQRSIVAWYASCAMAQSPHPPQEPPMAPTSFQALSRGTGRWYQFGQVAARVRITRRQVIEPERERPDRAVAMSSLRAVSAPKKPAAARGVTCGTSCIRRWWPSSTKPPLPACCLTSFPRGRHDGRIGWSVQPSRLLRSG